MNWKHQFRTLVVTVTSIGIVAPTPLLANVSSSVIPVKSQVEDVSLNPSGVLLGAIVDPNGKPVAGAPVVIAHAGKVMTESKTDQDGRFEFKGVQPGVYQVASHAKAQNYRVWQPTAAPVQAKQGVVHVMPSELMRGGEPVFGGSGPLAAIVTHPLLIAGLVVTTAVVIGAVALSDDDDAS